MIRNRKNVYVLFACGFLVLWMVLASVRSGVVANLLWFCNVALIVVFVGLLMNSNDLIQAGTILEAIPFIVWTGDGVLALFGRGVVDFHLFFFDNPYNMYHYVLFPILLFIYWDATLRRRAVVLAGALTMLLLLITRAVTGVLTNTNCVYYPCLPWFDRLAFFSFGSWLYVFELILFTLVWFVLGGWLLLLLGRWVVKKARTQWLRSD